MSRLGYLQWHDVHTKFHENMWINVCYTDIHNWLLDTQTHLRREKFCSLHLTMHCRDFFEKLIVFLLTKEFPALLRDER
jgi:hypothetical protein